MPWCCQLLCKEQLPACILAWTLVTELVPISRVSAMQTSCAARKSFPDEQAHGQRAAQCLVGPPCAKSWVSLPPDS